MNTETPNEKEQAKTMFEIAESLARKNCKHCYGRGFEGVRVSDGKIITCRCIHV